MGRRVHEVVLSFVVLNGLCLAQTLSPDVKAFVKTDASVIALTHVRVIDGTGGRAREPDGSFVQRKD